MHEFDYSVPHFITSVRGMRIVVTPQIVTDVLHVPRVEFPNCPGCDRLKTMSKNELNLSVSVILIGVSISSLIIRALLKALDFLTCS